MALSMSQPVHTDCSMHNMSRIEDTDIIVAGDEILGDVDCRAYRVSEMAYLERNAVLQVRLHIQNETTLQA